MPPNQEHVELYNFKYAYDNDDLLQLQLSFFWTTLYNSVYFLVLHVSVCSVDTVTCTERL